MKTAHMKNKYRFNHNRGFIDHRAPVVIDSIDDCWMTAREAAEYLRVGYKRLLNMSSNGQIPYRKLGNSNRYLKSELIKMLNSNRKGPDL